MLLGVNSLLKTAVDAESMSNAIGDRLNRIGLGKESINDKIDDVFRKKRVLVDTDATDKIKDSSWVGHSMMTKSLTYDPGDDMLRFWGSADLKFEDTSLGGNYVINPRPQFTRYADTRARGILKGTKKVSVGDDRGRFGMGLYYAEAIDDTHQTIHMRFGVPEFNSMIGYIRNFFNDNLNRLASQGRITPKMEDFIYYGAKAIVGWAFKGLHLVAYSLKHISSFFNFIMQVPASKYYYLRPTMVVYWATVTNLVNTIASYRGWLTPNAKENEPNKDDKTRIQSTIDESSANFLHDFLPDIFSATGLIDVYAAATRAERIRITLNESIRDTSESVEDYAGYKAFAKDFLDGKRQGNTAETGGASLQEAWKAYKASNYGTAKEGEGGLLSNEKSMRSVAAEKEEGKTLSPPDSSSLITHFRALQKDGGDFATFRVDHTGSVEESFQSSTGETDIAQKFNSASAQGRSAKFALFGGNIDGGIVDTVKNSLGAAVEGGIRGIPFVGDAVMDLLKTGAGAAYADVPEYWQNSSASLPKMSYTMQLVSPYGNPVSQMINIYIPLCMLLAGSLPLSTGKQSYTAPFLCQVFDQGRCQTRLGIIDSLQVTRGTSNLGFNKNKQALAIDVTFTVKDLSTVMHMPVATGWALDPLEGIFDEDTVFSDYMSVLASNSLGKNVYVSQQFNKRFLTRYKQMQMMTSPSFWAGYLHDMTPIRMLDAFVKESDRI